MKKTSTFLLLVLLVVISACEAGPEGQQGPQGPAGADGLIGSVFEVEASFNAENNYSALVGIPESIEVYNSDIVMAYVLVRVENEMDVWEPLPRTLFFENGIALYGFDHTSTDVNFFLDGDVDKSTLPLDFLNGLVFRVAVIPADFAAQVNVNDLNEVMGKLKVNAINRLQ